MSKPLVIMDPYWRSMDELFSSDSLAMLHEHFDIVWGRDKKIPDDVYDEALPNAMAIVAANPVVNVMDLQLADNLRAIIEVSGAFPNTVDYAACSDRQVDVLSCSPGFRRSVAEMGLAMLLSGARGLIREHEAFRYGRERWLDDCAETDFTLHGAQIGFIGFGQISREIARLITPFKPKIRTFDPWLSAPVADSLDAELCKLETLIQTSRAVFINAVPTTENYHLVGHELLQQMANNTLIILLSRAHLVDFTAMAGELEKGRFYFACDVFPDEPLPEDHKLRKRPNVILSSHRAAAVDGGRQLIGEMIVDDLLALARGKSERRLVSANPDQINLLVGVSDGKKHGYVAK